MKRRILKRRRDGHLQRYWRGTWKHRRTPEYRQKQLIAKFASKPLGPVIVKKDSCKIIYDGHMLEDPFEFKPHVPTIANWKRRKRGIVIDSNVKKKHVRPLLVHEAVEEHMGKTYGFRYGNAHAIATEIEKKYIKRQGKDWQAHQVSVLRTPT